ncbi:replication factor C subunit 1 [Reticulomyxa filosa]|uniref:Replication factor C subunit 1 n=1 Tax=Reticulomyxa filosa TaxID=46433 RepID=X6LXB9_RETFI|nr:replication factor C subunit 1 [Reticulomyxa filosa]|eukprot:ETO05996.1 replication factor C subunit 1 [Reticulomyxa filosa]
MKKSSLIADGDLFDNTIRSTQQYDTLPMYGLLSTYFPARRMGTLGASTKPFPFPSILGKNSRQGKHERWCRELAAHMRQHISGGMYAVSIDYLELLQLKLTRPLEWLGEEGIPEVLDFMQEYGLSREDWDSILELGVQNATPHIPAPIKTKFTLQFYLFIFFFHPFLSKKRLITLEAPKKSAAKAEKADLKVFAEVEEVIAKLEDTEGDTDDDEDAKEAQPKKKAAKKNAKKPKKKDLKDDDKITSAPKQKQPKKPKQPKQPKKPKNPIFWSDVVNIFCFRIIDQSFKICPIYFVKLINKNLQKFDSEFSYMFGLLRFYNYCYQRSN